MTRVLFTEWQASFAFHFLSTLNKNINVYTLNTTSKQKSTAHFEQFNIFPVVFKLLLVLPITKKTTTWSILLLGGIFLLRSSNKKNESLRFVSHRVCMSQNLKRYFPHQSGSVMWQYREYIYSSGMFIGMYILVHVLLQAFYYHLQKRLHLRRHQ